MRESGKISSPFEQRINCVSTSMLRLCLWLHECKWMTELQFLSVSSKRFISDPFQYHLTPVSSITLLLSYDRCNSITFCFFKTAVSLEHSFPKFHSTLSKLSLRLDVTHWHSQRVGLSIRLSIFISLLTPGQNLNTATLQSLLTVTGVESVPAWLVLLWAVLPNGILESEKINGSLGIWSTVCAVPLPGYVCHSAAGLVFRAEDMFSMFTVRKRKYGVFLSRHWCHLYVSPLKLLRGTICFVDCGAPCG